MDRKINEVWLFHGTKLENIRPIHQDGLDFDKASDGLYGKWIYLTDSPQKADQYMRVSVMLTSLRSYKYWGWGGVGVSDLKSAFNLSKSYHRLQVGFDGVCRYICRCGCGGPVLMVWAERLTLGSFWVPSHRLNSSTGEQKGITQTIILTPSLSTLQV